jgi:hypothetical protein
LQTQLRVSRSELLGITGSAKEAMEPAHKKQPITNERINIIHLLDCMISKTKCGDPCQIDRNAILLKLKWGKAQLVE